MDFGFDGFLDKFEQHFGKAATKGLLLLIGLAISAACLGVIWQYLVSPVLAFFQAPGRIETLGSIVVAGASIGAGVLLALQIYEWFLGRKLVGRNAQRASLQELNEAIARLNEALADKPPRDG